MSIATKVSTQTNVITDIYKPIFKNGGAEAASRLLEYMYRNM